MLQLCKPKMPCCCLNAYHCCGFYCEAPLGSIALLSPRLTTDCLLLVFDQRIILQGRKGKRDSHSKLVRSGGAGDRCLLLFAQISNLQHHTKQHLLLSYPIMYKIPWAMPPLCAPITFGHSKAQPRHLNCMEIWHW